MKIIDIQVQVIFMMWREEEQKFHGTTRITKQAMSIHCMVKNTCGGDKKLKEKSDDLIKANQKFKKEGESVRNIIKSYNFSE